MIESSRSERVASPRRPAVALVDLAAGVAARVSAIGPDHEAELADSGLGVGSLVVIATRAPLGGPLVVRCGRARLAVPRRIAATILVEPLPEVTP